MQKQNAGNGDYIEVEKKNINIDTATSDEIYAAAQRSVNDAEKAFLLGVLADRVINKGESDNYGILRNHAAALRENEEKKERAKRREEERAEAAENAKKNREQLNAYAEETYGTYADTYIRFVNDPEQAKRYLEDNLPEYKETFNADSYIEYYADIPWATGKDLEKYRGTVTGDINDENIQIALDVLLATDPKDVLAYYEKVVEQAKRGELKFRSLLEVNWQKGKGADDGNFNTAFYKYCEERAAYFENLKKTAQNKLDASWVSWKLSLLGNGGELAQGLVDIYTDGISYWDTGEMTAAEAENFDVEVLKDVLTRV